MRILWLSHFVPYPPIGGAFQRSYHLLRHAASRHEVHLMALTNPRVHHRDLTTDQEAVSHLREFCSSIHLYDKPADASSLHRLWLILSSFVSTESYDARWLRSPSASGFMRAACPAVDLIHADTIGLAPYTALQPNMPYVLTHHNVESDLMRIRATTASNLARRVYLAREATKLRREERDYARRAAMNIVVSKLDRDRLREVAGDVPTAVVENGVDVDYFRPRSSGDVDLERGGPARLVFVGGMRRHANREAVLFFLAEVWPRLVSASEGRRWTVVGAEPPAALRSAQQQSPQLTVTGFVNDVRPYIDSASIYVCPIFSGGGTRLKILDALAMAKPLVATRFAVEGLDLFPGSHYLAADTAEEFVAQITRLERDAELARRVAAAGRALVEERFSWRVIGAQLHEAHEEALAPRGGATELDAEGPSSGPAGRHPPTTGLVNGATTRA